MGDRFLIVGLGNPGPRYAGNRHNVGFMAVDRLADVAGISIARSKFKAQYGTGDLDGASLVLLKPETFMNLSGAAVQAVLAFYRIPPADLLVVADEVQLPLGRLLRLSLLLLFLT